MQYELHLTLRQRAALRIAISFWENKEIQDKVGEFFESYYKSEIRDILNEWGKFTKTVIEEFNKDGLPQTLEVELIHIFKMIGEKILSWYYHIEYKYAISCIDKIHWTPYGTVDVVQYASSTWFKNPGFNTTTMYEFACNHVMIDYIDDLWNKIPSDLQDSCNSEAVYYFNQHILVYWKCCRNGDLSNLMRYLEVAAENFNGQDLHEFNYIYDLDHSIEVNMLRLSAHQGHFLAVKYFWEKLTEEERDENVLKCARIAVSRCYQNQIENRLLIRNYLINQYVEICIFLMNQMTESQKKAFFNKQLRMCKLHIGNNDKLDVRDEILKMLFSGWPWQELFMVVFKDMIRLLDNDSMMVCKFLDSITIRMSQDYGFGYSIEMGNYRNILREAWLIIPGTIKRKLKEEYHVRNFISDLIDVRDLDSLKLILNDPEIADVRDWYIGLGKCTYDELIEDNKYEILEQFIREIFKSKEEEKIFKQKINPWLTFVLDNNFHLADKFLDWIYSVPEERQSAKNRIDHKEICAILIDAYEFESFDKFLDWKFITEEEKKNCKDQFSDKEYIIRNICQIWTRYEKNQKLAKDLSSEYLHWIFKSEKKAVLFKKEIFVNLDLNEIILVLFAELGSKNITKDLLIWFLTPDEEIQLITEEEKKNCKDQFSDKEYIIRNICQIWTRYEKNQKLAKDLSSEYLHWIFKSEEKAVLFKKEIFVNLDLNEIILVLFAELERKNIMKDLLIWFLTPDEEIQRIEQLVAQHNQRL